MTIAWYHLIWIIPVAMAVGGQLTSVFENLKKYNLSDLELDVLKGLEQKAVGAEKALLAKIKGWL